VFSLLKKAQSGGSRAGLMLAGETVALARVRRRSGTRPMLERCLQAPLSAAIETDLAQLIQSEGLARARISASLNSDDYQLVQVEAPDVLPAELRAAVRWKLRDVINFHIDDAVVDVFEIPDQSRRGQARMMFAVAARSGAVQRVASSINRHARGFDVIDIPELCLRNLSSLLPQDQKGVALLVLGAGFGQLVLTRQGVLYLTRRIDFARRYDISMNQDGGNASGIDAASLALELQRSLDYYESHFDQTAIGDLVIAPTGKRASDLAAALANETGLRISLMQIEELFDVSEPIKDELTWPQLVAIGAALRTDSVEI
jgi:MSHA biogenesis protein MshI